MSTRVISLKLTPGEEDLLHWLRYETGTACVSGCIRYLLHQEGRRRGVRGALEQQIMDERAQVGIRRRVPRSGP